MKILAKFSQTQRVLMLLLVLLVANLLVWGSKVVAGFPAGGLFATGTAFAADGTVLKFSDKIEFKDDHFNYGVKVSWNGKSNSMQETGTATYGLLGEMDVELENGVNYGPSLLAEVELEDELAFERSYMQGGHAIISLLPLSGEFSQNCYYFLYMKKVYCGSSEQRMLVRLE